MPNDTTRKSTKRTRRGFGPMVAASVGALLLAGCDLGVFDPGTIEGDDLFDPAAIQPLVIGAERNLGRAISGGAAPHGGVFGAQAYLTDEIVHSGQWVGMEEWSAAVVVNDDVAETVTRWSHAQNARKTAEEAADIIRVILENEGGNPGASVPIATSLAWAGFSNRLLGDSFCDAVIEGGPIEPVSAFYERAEQQFGEAITIAQAANNTQLVRAAHAGRAQVRMMLGNWSGAVSDAGQVPTDFVHDVRMSDNTTVENNGLHVAFMIENQASLWGTPFAAFGTDLSGVQDTDGDPRLEYRSRTPAGDVLIGGDGRRETWRVLKYESRNSNHPIARGAEMRLIEAEALLVGGDVNGAMGKINELRSFHGMANVSAASETEAWYVLQRERGIELYAEGRRLSDLRRWASTPGYADFDVVRVEASADQPTTADQVRNVLDNPMGELCLPISRDERNSNPNIGN
ncbi:MAG: RagB/SusD family nutrient uptake outer membrane protein [Gemmatimonadales bacterium]|nr:MAG: RagB/SusD family nutrient uptake outer membrane protein [Gemmatimonadales bacterium]